MTTRRLSGRTVLVDAKFTGLQPACSACSLAFGRAPRWGAGAIRPAFDRKSAMYTIGHEWTRLLRRTMIFQQKCWRPEVNSKFFLYMP
jgi:hypothetical protein